MNKARNIYYMILIAILAITGWIYASVNPIFPIEKMAFVCAAIGVIHQGAYFGLSKYDFVQTAVLAFVQALTLLLLVVICHKSIPHYMIHQEIDTYYKLIGALMFAPAVYLSYRGIQGNEKISLASVAKQIGVCACIAIVSYVFTFGVFDKKFDFSKAERYSEFQERAGFEVSENLASVENGKVYFSETAENLSEEVESWENVAFVSCGETHILGLSFDGEVLAAGEGFFGQTDVNGMKNVEYIYAGNEKSYLISTEGQLFVVGLDCSQQDYEKLETLRELGNVQ